MGKKRLENLSKRGNKYYIDYYDKTGQRVRFSTETTSEDLAKEIRDEYFRNLKNQHDKNVGSPHILNQYNKINTYNQDNRTYTFDDVALKFLEEKTRNCTLKTLGLYKLIIKNLFKFFTGKSLYNINKLIIKEYENYRRINGLKDEWIRKELVVLQNILNLAVEYDMLHINPFINYKFKKQLKDYEPKERFLTPKEAQRLIKCSNSLLAIQLITLFNTGLRINELLNLLYTDVSIDMQTKINYITVRKEIAKSKKERIIPLNKEAMEQINKMKIMFPGSLFIFVDPKGNPYKTTPKKALETAKRKAGLEDIGGFHITRHTAGSWWLQGINLQGQEVKPLRIEIVKELLGHSSVLITEKHYARLTKQNLLLSFED